MLSTNVLHSTSMARVGGTRVYSTDCTVVSRYTIFNYILYIRGVQTILPKNQIIWELKIAQYKILAQGTKFGSGTTGLDNHAVH